MKIKGIIVIILLMNCLSLISAVTISINSTSISAHYSEEKIIPVTIYNENNYTIYNIKVLGNYTTMDMIDNLSAGQSLNYTVKMKVNKTGNFLNQVTFYGYKKINCVEAGSTNHIVELTSSGFNPSGIKICSADTVTFRNRLPETVNLNIDGLTSTCPGDITIPSNGESSGHVFPQIGQRPISICSPLYLDNLVEVHNDEILVHESVDDYIINLNVTGILNQTTLSVEYITATNYTMSYNEVKVGSIIIKNIGVEKAVGIRLKGDWFIFSKSNFEIAPGETKSIDFSIYPDINTDSQTNKSYDKSIIISGENTENLTQNFNIFVLYSKVIAGEGDLAYLEYLNNVFCPSHPYSFLCEQQPRIVEREVPKYNCPSIILEMTPEKVFELINKAAGDEDTTKLYNLVKTYAEGQNVSIDSVLGNLNHLRDLEEGNKSFMNEGFTINYVIFFAFMLIIVGAGAFLLIRRFTKTKVNQKDI